VADETKIVVVGNLTADPELRFTPGGHAVVSFTIASTPRQYDRDSNEWKDGEALFLRCNAWRDMANHVADTLVKGSRVIVQGQLQQRRWETPEGDKRSSFELLVDEVGPSLRYATAKIMKVDRSARAADFDAAHSARHNDTPSNGEEAFAAA
jgi:single-strand DNA-binding protein